MPSSIEIRAWRDSMRVRGDKVNLTIYSATHVGSIVMEEFKDELSPVVPSLTINSEQAQGLMDSLWDCGIRPASGHGSSGQREALESHLAHVSRILDAVLPTAVRKKAE